jgi:hypothetical protein
MKERVSLNTNILVYLFDADDPAKQGSVFGRLRKTVSFALPFCPVLPQISRRSV